MVSMQGSRNHQSRVMQVYEKLKSEIIRCKIEPSSHVTQNQLSEWYSASRGTIHLALKQLANEGLVIVLPREGYQVRPITLREVRDLTIARIAVEPFAVRRAAERSSSLERESLLELAEAQARSFDSTGDCQGSPGDRIQNIVDTNRSFHLGIAEAARSTRLYQIIETLLDETDRLSHFTHRHSGKMPEGPPQHLSIVEAILRGDSQAAAHAMQVHLEYSEKWSLDSLILNPSLQSVDLKL